jgi:hypothetical protein
LNWNDPDADCDGIADGVEGRFADSTFHKYLLSSRLLLSDGVPTVCADIPLP